MLINKLIKSVAVYLGSSWVLLESVSFFINRFDYPRYYEELLMILLAFGLISFLVHSYSETNKKVGRKYIVGMHVVNLMIVTSIILYHYQGAKYAYLQHKIEESNGLSIAVLPFKDLSPDKSNAWLGDALCSQMIDHLGSIQSIDVKSQSSSFYFKDKDFNPVQIANLIGVNNLVEGNMLIIDSMLQISVKLFNPLTGSQLWNETFSRPLDNLMQTQAEIALLVAEKIGAQLTSKEEKDINEPITNNPDAYQAFMQGKYHYYLVTLSDNKRAYDLFQKAIDLDPNLAEAYVYMAAVVRIFGGYWLGISPDSAFAKTKELYERALELKPGLPYGLFMKSNYMYFYERDYAGGLELAKRAYELADNKDDIIWMYAQMLGINKKSEESLRILNEYLQKNPTSAKAHQGRCMANVHHSGRDLSVPIDSLLTDCYKAMELNPSMVYSKYYMAEFYFMRGYYKESNELFQELYNLTPVVHFTEGLFRTHYYLDEIEIAERYLIELYRHHSQYKIPYRLAAVYATINNIDSVVYYLNEALTYRDIEIVAVWNEPAFDPVRKMPAFKEILAQLDYAGISSFDPNNGLLLFNSD